MEAWYEKGLNTELSWHVSPERYLALLGRMLELTAQLTPAVDSLVGLKRSGLFPAVVLSQQLKVPMFTDSEVRVFPCPKFTRPLIVDTSCWGGASARKVIRKLEGRGVSEPRVLAMFVRLDPPPDVDRLHYLEAVEHVPRFWYDNDEPLADERRPVR